MRYLCYLALLIPVLTLAMPTEHLFVAGKDYQLLPPTKIISETITKTTLAQNNQQPVKVIEFFSYGCPACNHLEPDLEVWLKNRTAKLVQFERVPVVFHDDWVNYAKAYYTAKMLGIESKITPAIFAAIHEQQQDLSSADALAKFFAKQGVDEQIFKSIFNFTPGMAVKLNRGNQLMGQYKIVQIPALVVNGKYITNPALTKGDNQKLLSVVDHLINQELIATSGDK